MDVIEQQQPDPLDSMELAGNVRRLFALMEECLTPRERQILMMRYGLNGKHEVTQNEIGAALGISRRGVKSSNP